MKKLILSVLILIAIGVQAQNYKNPNPANYAFFDETDLSTTYALKGNTAHLLRAGRVLDFYYDDTSTATPVNGYVYKHPNKAIGRWIATNLPMADNVPTHNDLYNFPRFLRALRMRRYVIQEGINYELKGGTADENWTPLTEVTICDIAAATDAIDDTLNNFLNKNESAVIDSPMILTSTTTLNGGFKSYKDNFIYNGRELDFYRGTAGRNFKIKWFGDTSFLTSEDSTVFMIGVNAGSNAAGKKIVFDPLHKDGMYMYFNPGSTTFITPQGVFDTSSINSASQYGWHVKLYDAQTGAAYLYGTGTNFINTARTSSGSEFGLYVQNNGTNTFTVDNLGRTVNSSLSLTKTDGTSYINLYAQSGTVPTPTNGVNLHANSAGKITWKNTAGYNRTLDFGSTAADITAIFPFTATDSVASQPYARAAAAAAVAGIGSVTPVDVSSTFTLTNVSGTGTTIPSATTVAYYGYSQSGSASKMITFWAKIKFSSAGSAVTLIAFDLPAGVPVPKTYATQFNGAGAYIERGTGVMGTGTTVAGTNGTSFIRRNAADTGYEVGVSAGSTNLSTLWISVTYQTN